MMSRPLAPGFRAAQIQRRARTSSVYVPDLTPFKIADTPKFWADFSRPSAVYRNNATYVGWTDMVGATGVSKYNHATGTAQHFTLAAGDGTPNGHNSSVFTFLPDGRILALWSVQNSAVYRRISSNPEDITAWGAVATVSSNVRFATYCNLHYLSITGKYYVHFRDGNGGGPGNRSCCVRDTTDGTTWSGYRFWITEPDERPYVISRSDGVSKIHFFMTSKGWGDTGTLTNASLYHVYMVTDAAGNEMFYKSDGTAIAATDVRPSTQATLIATASAYELYPSDLAIGADGHPRVLWWRLATDDDHRHMFARWNGTSWVTTEIGASGPRSYPTGSPLADGRLCFDTTDANIIYRGNYNGSTWQMEDWRTSDNGATWTKYRNITSVVSPTKALNPVSPYGHDGKCAVVWEQGTINNWNDFATDAYGGAKAT